MFFCYFFHDLLEFTWIGVTVWIEIGVFVWIAADICDIVDIVVIT